jgi:outer membrane receptor for ferrienterochelin and colicins
MRQLAIFILLLHTHLCSIGQSRINIHVQDATTGTSLPKATIIINKKSFVTDTSGNIIHVAVNQTIDLSVSYTGYNTYSARFIAKDSFLTVSLQPVAEEGEEVIIVASSRNNSRIEDLPTKVEVLGSEEVNEENQIKPGNIASLLGDIAGVQIQQTNAATGSTDMRIQGLPGKYTQILRDGMPLFDGYSGSFGILQVPPLDLQQIEIIKGAASTLYGGGAIAGMVNLISKKPKQGRPDRSFTLNRSTLKENNLNMFFSGRNNTAGYTLFAGGTLQDNIDVNDDGFSDVPEVHSVFIHPRLFIYGKRNSSLVAGYNLAFEMRKGGDMQVLDDKTDTQHKFFIQNKTLRHTGDVIWENRLQSNAMLTAKGSLGISSRDITTNISGIKASQAMWYTELSYAQKTGAHNYVLGINFNGDRFKKKFPDSSFIPNTNTGIVGLFVQDDWKPLSQLTIQAGARLDHSSMWGSFFLPKLSLMYRPSKKITMRAGGGTGYKTPALFSPEIDERDIKYLVGFRDDIIPEKSWGLNYDINYKTKKAGRDLTFNQTFYITTIDRPFNIEHVPAGAPYFRYFNEDESLQTRGAESYVQAIHHELELYFGYVLTDSKRKYNAANPHFPLVAKHKLAAIIAYEFSERFRAGIESSFNGRQFRDNGTKTPSYLFLAAMVRYNVGKLSFVLNGENLLDYRQSKKETVVFPPYDNPVFPEIWAPLDGRVINLSIRVKW